MQIMNVMKNYIIFIILALAGFTAAAQSGCIQGNCDNGEGILVLENGIKYVGQFQNGKYEGIGICYWPNGGGRYQGEWKNNLPHGKGSRLLSTGKMQAGWFENGIFVGNEPRSEELVARDGVEHIDRKSTGCIIGDCENGRGVYVYNPNKMYTGWFRNGKVHGTGVCHFENGSKYEGEWSNNQPHGQGTMTYPDGRECSGQWRQGVLSQPCTSTLPEQPRVKFGCIAGDCINGEGHIVYMDRTDYRGEFKNAKPHGDGVMAFPNGDRYEGAFANGNPHGRGVKYLANNSVQNGQWFEGEFLGAEKQEVMAGCIDGDCENGSGTYIFDDKSQYTGTFKNGYAHGRGTIIYPNGDRYEGEMKNGFLYGYGTLFAATGKQYSGEWVKGELEPGLSPTLRKEPSLATNSGKKKNNLEVYAVIIGVSDYSKALSIRSLKYTDDDAYKMYAFLKSPQGGALDDDHIRILIDEDATLHNIKRTMRAVFEQAGPEDLIMLYYSGHGQQDAFLPYDYYNGQNKLYHEEIIGLLDRSPAKYKLCIADACYAGAMFASKGGEPSQKTQDFYDRLSEAAPGTALIMSSKSDETSLESKGLRQGVFTHFLMRGLKGEADVNQDHFVDISELFDFVSYNVQDYTEYKQSPLIEGTYDRKMPVAVW